MCVLEKLFTDNMLQFAASWTLALATLLSLLSLFRYFTSRTFELSIAAMVVSIALFSNSTWVYIISLFIIGTGFTSTSYLETIAAIIFKNKDYFKSKRGSITPTDDFKSKSIKPKVSENRNNPRSAMELKILNTFWIKQVNKFPNLEELFAFRIGSDDPDFIEYQRAISSLNNEGLVRVDLKEGIGPLFCLTLTGLRYCKENYKNFPVDQWWPNEIMNEANLPIVLNHGIFKSGVE